MVFGKKLKLKLKKRDKEWINYLTTAEKEALQKNKLDENVQ